MITECTSRSAVGAVAIGRNEGQRLRACLESLVRDLDQVVYVDSGSDDDSLSIAQALGVEIVQLDTRNGFTAARARNAGIQRLLEVAPGLEFVQFVDGDCEVVENWIDSGLSLLRENPQVAIACGRRREIEPTRNIYHQLADMEWNATPGETHSCGGDALVRLEAFQQVGGYRESLIAGEEPELCTRLRKNGWKVWRLDREMTLHDIRMTRFRQWWRRTVRAGHAYAEVAALHGSLRERYRWRMLVGMWFWVLLPVAAIALLPTLGVTTLLAVAIAYALLILKGTIQRQRHHSESMSNSILYAFSCALAKWPQALGTLKYLRNRISGSRSQLMEYSQHAMQTCDHQQSQQV